MSGAVDEPVAESEPSVHAGCVAGPEQGRAGCDGRTGEESQAAAPPSAADESAGCAASAPMEASDTQATPPQTMREFEHALRELGFTRLQAEHIARKGFRGVTALDAAAPEPEREPDLTSLAAALERRGRALKGH